MKIIYDNSDQNPRNPRRPPVNVRFGEPSADEMGSVYFQVVPARADELDVLDRDLALKRLRTRVAGLNHRLVLNSRDLDALERLGDLYLGVGAFARAVLHYRWALEAGAEDYDILYHLGVALLEEGAANEAAGYFRRATALDPDEPEAYHALGIALVRLDRLEEALVQYRQAVALDAGRAESVQNLEA